ncbi:arginine-specific demethylase JMJ22-like [Corylus avellana]|uniref:arginine-specific demethylase JMJ22-like n=1 Tax=Corylus avellana TaxID=13451 RepID=UPI00286CEDEF|nr:arginine-specific demethylase JMJ22-like [Corylus avellana]
MKLEDYFRYSDQAREERPLYLFDPKFAEKVPKLGLEYEVPVYFQEDLFSVLGHERPDYRWIIIGLAGSGSSFHIDPNSTSAWDAVIKGSKKWVLFPPDLIPPGVHPSPDGAEVACPVSIIEWFMNFYITTKTWKKKPIECICKAGEVIFVPNGWWHLVINLEESIAITQNYASRRNLLNVMNFLINAFLFIICFCFNASDKHGKKKFISHINNNEGYYVLLSKHICTRSGKIS